MKLILPVNTYDEYLSPQPDFCEVNVSAEKAERVRKLAAAAAELDVYKIVEFDRVDEFYWYDYAAVDENSAVVCEDFRWECTMLNVARDHFYWSGLVKNTDVRWETDAVWFNELDDSEDVTDLRRD